MAVTETTTESWGSRLGGSFKGVLVGLAMFIAGFPILFWNEGDSVRTAKALDEGEGACIPVESNAKVDPELDGRLVHMAGRADTKDVLSDDEFGVSATAIALERKTEMYQWIESSETKEKKNLGGSVTKTTTYTYRKDWSEDAVDSSDFKEPGHDNPAAIEFPSLEKRAANVTFGAFRLNEGQIKRIGHAQAYSFPTDFVCKVERVQLRGGTVYVPNRETRENPLNNRDVQSQPRVGDMRVTFSVVRPHDVSIVAKQRGDGFTGYIAKTKKRIDMLSDGVRDVSEMFDAARSANTFKTWLIRLVGLFIMYLGLSKVFKPLSTLADVLPILGDIVEMGTGLVAGVLAIVCALATIAVAWIFYRPVLGVLLLVAAGGLAFLLWKMKMAKKAAPVQSAN